jgi:pilus assembly protein CpaF
MGMGSALNNQIVSVLGVQGGVGCSSLTALVTRSLAAKNNYKIGVLDGTPFNHSMLFSYLPMSSPSHSLIQLEPYQDHLNSKLIEKYFSSVENITYIPAIQKDEENSSANEIINLISKISSFFDFLLIDLSSFSFNRHSKLLEISDQKIVLTSPDNSSLLSLKKTKSRLNDYHLDTKTFGLILNQTHPSQTLPKDVQTLSDSFRYIGTVPFLGEYLSIDLLGKKQLQTSVEKSINMLVEFIVAKKIDQETKNSINENSNVALPEEPEKISINQIHELHQKLLDNLRKSGHLKESQKGDAFLREKLEPLAKEVLNNLIQEMKISTREVRQQLALETINLAFGLGPLEQLLQNNQITEIMANGPHQIYIETKGTLQKSDVRFLDDLQLRTSIERILSPIGRRLDESQPYVDGRLLDGSRVNAVIPPISLNGPLLTIRKFSKKKLTVNDLINFGSMTQEAADFLGACVKARKNIVVSGGTGSGKTTLLNILSNFIPSTERIITIEDSAELQLAQDHVVRLEGRPANLEGKGHISIRDLVINALRMRPDRIVVGECRGGEALDMLQAMNTGHDGSMTTAHANTSRDVISRLETMCLFAGVDLPLKAIREQISRAVELVVQQTRLPSGKRSITQISEIQGMEGDVIIIQDIFVYDKDKGLIRQPFIPSFIKSLNAVGYEWPGTK